MIALPVPPAPEFTGPAPHRVRRQLLDRRMSGQWKPGTVAMVTVPRDPKPVLAFRDCDEGAIGWTLSERRRSSVWIDLDLASDVRPLVVIDPEDRAQVERLTGALAIHGANPNDRNYTPETQAALRSLIAPPKPEEPLGLGSVVEDADGKRWIKIDEHADCNDWTPLGAPTRADVETVRWTYAEITAVRVLSEGVTA